MSKYSSDSDDNDYRGKSSRRKRRRSESSSSRDSYVKSSKRRSRKSRSHSRDSYRSKTSYKDKRTSHKDSRSQRSRSPYRNRSRSRRRYRSISRSRSPSRSSNSYSKKKSYSKSKRKYKSRSRSRSYHRKSRSHSRRRSRSKQRTYRSRSRSSSSSKKYKRSSVDRNGRDTSSSSDSVTLDSKHLHESQRKIQKDAHSKKNIKQESVSISDNSYTSITIPSDDPLVKQEQLDDINASSFTPKTFKSSKTSNHCHQEETPSIASIKLENELNNLCVNNFGDGLATNNDDGALIEKRKNETVFHDSIAFEDSEQKIQKWVKKLFILRQKFLYGYPKWDRKES